MARYRQSFLAAVLLSLLSLLILTSTLSAQEERDYALYSLLIENEEILDQEIERMADARREIQQRQLAMLLLSRYIREEKRRDAYKALDILSGLPAETNLQKVYLGMGHAFAAKIKTIFGVSHLKEMQRIMEEIPTEHEDWLVRFLRGNTLVQVASALPGIFSIKDIKERALRLGRRDLEYVIRFPGVYGPPVDIVQQAKKVLDEY